MRGDVPVRGVRLVISDPPELRRFQMLRSPYLIYP